MEKIVSITKQGQLTIPRKFLVDLNIRGATKAVVRKLGDTIVVQPKHDFWSLSGSLKSKISLTDKELRTARESFGRSWPQKS
ncbi:MAG: AbrB/MazE/SpoVT family DNA-binding domain-containing protein [bacterium]|nr:AbrB/MazE/SpoVT family DNA-binding domain-containing protein [bacterium]